MKQLLAKLLIIQKEVDAIHKGEKGFNYSYAGQEQVLNTIRPLMNDNGLLLMQEVLEVENTRIDYTTGKGDYIKEKSEILTSATQKFTWFDVESGEKLEALFHGNGMNDWEKGLGSALTYAERYFLLKFFHIPTPNDDPDKRQVTPDTTPAPVKSAPKPQTEADPMQGIIIEVEACTEQKQLSEMFTNLSKADQEMYRTIFNNRREALKQ